jgi:hypothetical protein
MQASPRPLSRHPLGTRRRRPGRDPADFWRWPFSDLRENTTRGILAELLVAYAVGAVGRLRRFWDNYDLLTPSGVRVAVKASSYLQSWPQRRLSRLRFGKLTGRGDENTPRPT